MKLMILELLIAGLFLIATTAAQEPPREYTPKALDDAASGLTNGGGVAELASAVFGMPHQPEISSRQMPGAVTALLQNRFASAESAFWEGRHPGVKESDLVSALNRLATAMALPAWAQVTQVQLRNVRMRMFLPNPRFMGLKMSHKSAGQPARISPVISPLQAYHLAMTMIDVKLQNPYYQVTPEEWDRRAAAAQPAGAGLRGYTRMGSPAGREITAAWYNGLANMTDAAGLALLAQTLSDLGVL